MPPSDQRGQTHGIYQTVYQKPFQKCKQGLAFSKALATPDLRSGGRSDHPRQTRDRSSKTSQEFSQPTNPYLESERSVEENHRPLSNEVTSNKSRPNGTRKGILGLMRVFVSVCHENSAEGYGMCEQGYAQTKSIRMLQGTESRERKCREQTKRTARTLRKQTMKHVARSRQKPR